MQPTPTTPYATRQNNCLPTDLVALIDAEIYACERVATYPMQYHFELQDRLQSLGERLGYISKLEFLTPPVFNGRRGQIDVVWTGRDGRRGVAFELDACWRRKSIVKLLHMAPTHHPVWIVYGDPYMSFAPEDYALDQLIIIEPDLARLPPLCRARPGRQRFEAYRRQQRALKSERRMAKAAARREADETGQPAPEAREGGRG